MTQTCPKYKTTHLIRSGSMFENCAADLNLVIFGMYLWTVGTQEKLACHLTRLPKPTIIMVYGLLRVMCRRYFENNLIKLGGEGVVAYKTKHHHLQHWKPRNEYVHCLFTTVHKKCKIVIIRYKIKVQYNLYIKSVNCKILY
jgi:hypothetical protein